MFKKFFCLGFSLLAVVLNCNFSLAAGQARKQTPKEVFVRQKIDLKEIITVHSGTIIPISYKEPVYSKYAKIGNIVPITVKNDVEINNKLVFAKGASGVAYIEDANPAKLLGKPAYIKIVRGKINDIYGNEYNITLTNYFFGSRFGDDISIHPREIFDATITSTKNIEINNP